MVIGSDPSVRGAGFGQALMRSRLDRCDGERAPAYLEASEESLIPYYSRFGFEQIGEIDIPGRSDDDPDVAGAAVGQLHE